MSEVPANLKYTKSHEWIMPGEDNVVTVGITDHAQEMLGDLVYVELPEEGQAVSAEDGCAVVESVKAASDVYSPVTGQVVAVNETLADSPETVNSDPYGDGWLMRVKLEDGGELDQYMDAAAYKEFLASEED